MRCTPSNDLTLERVIGRLISFEMLNFDNYTPATIKSSFKSQLVLSKKGKGKHVKNENDTSDDEFDELDALMARRLQRGKGNYKGKHPIIFFSCKKVGHSATRCLDTKEKDEKREKK